MDSSQADVWYLKEISFERRRVKIITQNLNGPCSFIAICNILILRNQINILPPDRTTVSYEFLSQLVGEYLLTNCPDIDISAALSIMPSTTKGLDLNPQFTSVTAFSPVSDVGELALFSQAGIQLVHGWVVDPESPEANVMAHICDYDSAVTLIVDADYITHGKLLGGDEDRNGHGHEQRQEGSSNAVAGPSSSSGANAGQYSDQDRHKIEHAIIAQQFLDATKSQLTYHGLFQLASTIQPGSLVALFRNAHLSVVYKSVGDPSPDPGPGPCSGPVTPHPCNPSAQSQSDRNSSYTQPRPTTKDPALYALVTDDVFLHEPSIVWERLEDIDGGSSWFVDSDFHRAIPIGGDVAGQTAEGALRRLEMVAGTGIVDPTDQALARQMQAEEDAHAREMYMRHQQQQQQQQQQQVSERRRRTEQEGEERRRRERWTKGSGKGRKGNSCIVM